jgi:hypothetical protein
MFDVVSCHYPLPHHQDAEFQTKDLARVVLGLFDVEGTCSFYQITAKGELCRHRRRRIWAPPPSRRWVRGSPKFMDWWERIERVHGDVRIYTSEGTRGTASFRWFEFRVTFTHGRVSVVREVAGTD